VIQATGPKTARDINAHARVPVTGVDVRKATRAEESPIAHVRAARIAKLWAANTGLSLKLDG
jgi:hypothetical protein